MKLYITCTAPSRNAKTTLSRFVVAALRQAGFENVIQLDPDASRRAVGLFPIEAARVKEWGRSQAVYVSGMQAQVERSNGRQPSRAEREEELRARYDELLEEARQEGLELAPSDAEAPLLRAALDSLLALPDFADALQDCCASARRYEKAKPAGWFHGTIQQVQSLQRALKAAGLIE